MTYSAAFFGPIVARQSIPRELGRTGYRGSPSDNVRRIYSYISLYFGRYWLRHLHSDGVQTGEYEPLQQGKIRAL